MTDEEIAIRQLQRRETERLVPLYQRLLEWPICILLYIAVWGAAPFILLWRFVLERRDR